MYCLNTDGRKSEGKAAVMQNVCCYVNTMFIKISSHNVTSSTVRVLIVGI